MASMKALASLSAFVVALVGCGGENPEPETPAAPQPVAPAPQPVAATPAPAPISVEGHKTVSCKLESKSWTGNVLRLRTSPSDNPFVVVGEGVQLTVSTGQTKDEGFFVEAEGGPVKLRGYLRANELPLYAAAAAELKGFVIPTQNAELSFLKGSPDTVVYEVNLDAKRAQPVQSNDTKPCAFFSLERKTFDALSASGSSAQKSIAIKPGHYDLLDEPKGKPVGSIDVDDKSPYGSLLARNGSKARVAWPVDDVLVVGWIDALKVVEQRETIKTGGGIVVPSSGPASERKTGVDGWQKAKCSEEIKLYTDVDNKRFLIGRVKANQSIQIGPVQGSVRGVAFPDADVLASDSARLVIDAGDAAKCK